MKDIVIIGAGGMGRETAWLIEQINQVEKKWNILGYLDDNDENVGKILSGYKVLGKIEIIDSLPNEVNVVIAIGNGKIREKIVERLGKRNYPILIHPNVNIAKSSDIGEGTIICSGALISIETKIGKHCIINFNSIIAHDSIIEDFVTIHVNVNISGNVLVEKFSTIGSGASIYQGKKIEENCMIGIGSAVIKKVKKGKTALGVPAEIY